MARLVDLERQHTLHARASVLGLQLIWSPANQAYLLVEGSLYLDGRVRAIKSTLGDVEAWLDDHERETGAGGARR